MNLFRKHIIRHIAGLSLLLAIGMHIAIPYSSKAQKTAFVQWLDKNVVPNDSDSESLVRNHIRRLPDDTGSFDLFLIKASRLVASNHQNFKFPDSPSDGEPIYLGQWLVAQWNSHQQSTSSGDAVLPAAPPIALKWASVTDNFHSSAVNRILSAVINRDVRISAADLHFVPSRHLYTFLTGSISINAP